MASHAIDHPYRATDTAAPQARWRDWRTLALIFAALCALLLGCLSSRTRLACDRGAGSCQLTKETATASSSRSVELSDVTGASLTVHRGARWLRTYELALETRGSRVELRPAGSEDEMRAFTAAVDRFIHAPAAGSLVAEYGSVWGRFERWSIGLGVLFVLFAFSLPTVRVTADRAAQRLVFDLRPFGPVFARHRSYALAAVREARVAVRGTPAWVELVFDDGSSLRLPGSVASRGACEALAARINGVLRAVIRAAG